MNDNVKRLVEQGEEITAQRDKGLMARVRYEDFAKDNLPALLSALRELDEENARLNELCDAQKNRLEELWEEKARLREAQRWIPIKERLPGPNDGVGGDKMVIWLFRDTEDYFLAPWHYIVEDPEYITHWWRLPQPPEPEPEKEGQDA